MKARILYQLPFIESPLYLMKNGDRFPILRFFRIDRSGMKKPHTGGVIHIGDIALIRRRGRDYEVSLDAESIITELAVDPPPKHRRSSHA